MLASEVVTYVAGVYIDLLKLTDILSSSSVVEETGVFGGHDTVRSSDGLLGDGAGLVDEDRENHRR